MNIELSDEAAEYGRQASRAFETAGGDELVQKAQSDPEYPRRADHPDPR